MKARAARSSPLPSGNEHGTRAFLRLQVGLAILAVGLAAVCVGPLVRHWIIATRSEAVVRDLHTFAQAFKAYLRDKGDWPPSSPSLDQFPPGMESYLRPTSWLKPTPIGGRYRWENQQRHRGQRIQAAIAFASLGTDRVTVDRAQLESLDRKIDDGNLATGAFRLGFRNTPIFIVEP
jgi:type II secretory pathway pseudopilin PulG